MIENENTIAAGLNTFYYSYNADGIRTAKTVNGVKHTYALSGTTILNEEWTENGVQHLLMYVYDANGSPVGMVYRNSTMSMGVFEEYLFVKNIQGDILHVYSSTGNKLVSYVYDAWGNIISTTYSNGGATTAARFNPFTYRGYYRDSETGMYYLNSRYYNPKMGRFISADNKLSGVGNDIRGYNLFAYCFNNPVNTTDSNGDWPRWITAATAIAAIVVAAVAVAAAPVVATIAASVAVVSTVAYVAQSHHYDKRKAKNTNLPESPQEANDLKWRNSKKLSDKNPNGGGPAASCHQYTSPDKSNVKYVSPDGRREVIFDKYGNVVLDSRDIGTYNFSPSGTFVGSIGHFFADMLPWIIFGNDDDDPGLLANEIIRLFE